MHKISFDQEAANKVLSIVKNKLIRFPKRPVGPVSTQINQVGYAAVARIDHGTAAFKKALKKTPKPILKQFDPFRGRILTVKDGDAAKWSSSALFGVGTDKIPDKSRKMFDAVVKGHELDELKAIPNMTARQFGHNSMDVVLQEHNKLTTLPKEHKAVQQRFSEFRGPEQIYIRGHVPGFRHGESARLSRHARRRIMEKFLAAENRTYGIKKDKMTKKAQAVFNKLAGIGNMLEKLPKSVRKGVLATTMAGTLAASGAKAGEGIARGKWVDVVSNTASARRAAEMTGGNVFKGTPLLKGPHQGPTNVKLRLATGSEPDSLVATSDAVKEMITSNPRGTDVTRKITSFRNR